MLYTYETSFHFPVYLNNDVKMLVRKLVLHHCLQHQHLYGSWFMPQLPWFSSNCLLVWLRHQQNVVQLLGPLLHGGELVEAPGSRLCHGPVLVIASIQGVNQKLENLSLFFFSSLFHSLCNSAYNKYIYIFFFNKIGFLGCCPDYGTCLTSKICRFM